MKIGAKLKYKNLCIFTVNHICVGNKKTSILWAMTNFSHCLTYPLSPFFCWVFLFLVRSFCVASDFLIFSVLFGVIVCNKHKSVIRRCLFVPNTQITLYKNMTFPLTVNQSQSCRWRRCDFRLRSLSERTVYGAAVLCYFYLLSVLLSDSATNRDIVLTSDAVSCDDVYFGRRASPVGFWLPPFAVYGAAVLHFVNPVSVLLSDSATNRDIG